ncbi:hypothetical protein [Lewinella sp. W8]|uniref:hypothetical protein n=1 Tax=Lewinella sp. W8 TaxID=2528208 RepID=UPI0010684D6B|nr:hypothetical protein [Lewinella sp. W8]MTB52019.1 hypothetical protein [Lewinella sp. W8]
MKRITLLLAFLFFNTVGYGQSFYDLNWKLDNGEQINYQLTITSYEKLPLNMDSILNTFSRDSESELSEDDLAGLEKLRNYDGKTENRYHTNIRNSNHFEKVLDVTMIDTDQEPIAYLDDFLDSLGIQRNGITLRGTLNKSGTIHSFWMNRAQKNMLSLLFELPDHQIQKGDTWQLPNVNMTGNSQNFICHEAKKRNQVQLVDVEYSATDTIAVIAYDIMEYVSGEFTAAALFNKDNDTSHEATSTFTAEAKFSIAQGKWLEFKGRMEVETKGFMDRSVTQVYTLAETGNRKE